MNDEIEPLTGARHRATESGCRCWAPIALRSADEKDATKDELPMPAIAEDQMPTVGKKPL